MSTVTEQKGNRPIYTWNTPNGRKVSIMLEELGLPYSVFPIDITKGDQLQPDFLFSSALTIRFPAIVDHDAGIHLMESGAILLYSGEQDWKADLAPSVRNTGSRWNG